VAATIGELETDVEAEIGKSCIEADARKVAADLYLFDGQNNCRQGRLRG
jgi:hypothetical protein